MKVLVGYFKESVSKESKPQFYNYFSRSASSMLCTHEQRKCRLFAQILSDIRHGDPEIGQMKVTLFAHVYKAYKNKDQDNTRPFSVLSLIHIFGSILSRVIHLTMLNCIY